MGYDFTIGEFIPPKHYPDLSPGDFVSRLSPEGERYEDAGEVAVVSLPEAPAFGEPTDNTSARWPSYTTWANFTKFTGLGDLFGWDERKSSPLHLIPRHPGVAPLKPAHQECINAAIARLHARYPDVQPSMVSDREEDQHLARLTWLKFWVDWALANCRQPAFQNF